MFWKDISKKVFPNKIALEYDLSSTIRKNDISFSRKYDIVSCQKVKDDLSQKIHGNMMFSMYMKLPFCQKSKDYLLPQNTLKNDISGISKKDDAHHSKDDIGIRD